MSGAAPRVWALLDDRAGTASQCLGVAEALGLAFERRDLRYTAAGRLPNAVRGATFAGLTGASRMTLHEPWPEVVIAAGRRAAPIARAIKRRSGAFIVQVMHPGYSGAEDFDLIAAPCHDRRKPAPNVMEIVGAAHRVTAARLAEADKSWRPRFAHLPAPRIAVIVGGSTRRRAFTEEMAGELADLCNRMAREAGGALLATTSRRTGAGPARVLAEALAEPRFLHAWGDAGDNPYFGLLAVADAIVVTGDSVSMCTEACATGRPVFVFAPPDLITAKHGRLHADLFAEGHARPLDGRYATWAHAPLDPAAEIAAEVRRRLALRAGAPI